MARQSTHIRVRFGFTFSGLVGFVVDPEQAAIVRGVLGCFYVGREDLAALSSAAHIRQYSLAQEIADALNTLHVPAPVSRRGWNKVTVSTIVGNVAGYVTGDFGRNEATYPPLYPELAANPAYRAGIIFFENPTTDKSRLPVAVKLRTPHTVAAAQPFQRRGPGRPARGVNLPPIRVWRKQQRKDRGVARQALIMTIIEEQRRNVAVAE